MKNLAIVLAVSLLWSLGWAELQLLTTVGKVQNDVITSRDVYISGWIEKSLYASPTDTTQELPELKTGEFRSLVKAHLLETVVAMEAKSFSAVQLTDSEVARAEAVLKKKMGKSDRMKQLEVEPSEIRKSLKRKLISKKFIRFKAESSVVSVTDAEAKTYFEENRLKFGDLPFENFKENIKVFLTREQVDKRLRDWFEVLQAKYRVESYEDAQNL
ncbi:MAG: hypothetical protein AAF202_07300 [Pseudomonadota bacterium]